MSEDRKPVIGEELYLVDCGNRARRGVQHRSCIVTKVGRKYFDVTYDNNIVVNIHIDGWHENAGQYSSDYFVCPSKQHYLDSAEVVRLTKQIRDVFARYNRRDSLELDVVRKIAALVGLNKTPLDQDGEGA